MRTKAEAQITVHSSEAHPYEETPGPALVEVRLTETFTGDLEGESPVRALQVLRDDQEALRRRAAEKELSASWRWRRCSAGAQRAPASA